MPGFDYKFLEKPKRRLLCPLCAKAMREPVRVSTCGHRFCDTCLQEFLRGGLAIHCPCPPASETYALYRFSTLGSRETSVLCGGSGRFMLLLENLNLLTTWLAGVEEQH
uniref:Uncharacterized protein n=1 Tax=Sphaerodactylus townsendi TaxID=933632 RepID=A0ACB8ECY5_9SAUR